RFDLCTAHRFLICILMSLLCLFLSHFFFFFSYGHPPHLHSFPTRRSSDLAAANMSLPLPLGVVTRALPASGASFHQSAPAKKALDRKSTRLNSSHGSISYAVFCLKKKKKTKKENYMHTPTIV